MNFAENPVQSLPVYLINLDRNPERLEFMRKQMKSQGMHFIRVAASDGTDPEVVRKSRRSFLCRLGLGAVGCFESHIKVWETLISSEHPAAIVLEDDVILSEDFIGTAESAANLLEFDIIKLDFFSQSVRVESHGTRVLNSRCAFRFLGGDWGSGGYIISKSGAAKLIAKAQGYTRPVDNFLYDSESLMTYTSDIFLIVPAVCAQTNIKGSDNCTFPDFQSNIQNRNILPNSFLMRSVFRLRAWSRFESGPFQRLICRAILWHISRTRGVSIIRNSFLEGK